MKRRGAPVEWVRTATDVTGLKPIGLSAKGSIQTRADSSLT